MFRVLGSCWNISGYASLRPVAEKAAQKNCLCLYVSGKVAHVLRYANDTDAISFAVMDNNYVVTALQDLNIVCWNIVEGKTRRLDFFYALRKFSSTTNKFEIVLFLTYCTRVTSNLLVGFK